MIVDTTIMVAIISSLGVVLSPIFGVIAASKMTNFRLQQLEEKVKLHNNLIERMSIVELRTKTNEQRLDKLDGGR